MKNEKMVHLHAHTRYSVRDGLGTSKQLAEQLSEGDVLAITDHDSMGGIVEHDKACSKVGVKPIFGVELAIHGQHNVTLLAETNEGLSNLFQLMTKARTWYTTHSKIGYEYLSAHSAGVICMSGDLSSVVSSAILNQDKEALKYHAGSLKQIYGDRFYLEQIQWPLRAYEFVNNKLDAISKMMRVKLVTSNDIHYPTREMAQAQAVLVCDRMSKLVRFDDPVNHGMDLAFLRPIDMAPGNYEIAERCQAKIEYNQNLMPEPPVPHGHTPETWLREVVSKGGHERLGSRFAGVYTKRLEYELGVIEKMGFSGYYLIVHDIIAHARMTGVPVGPGRGSGAGSIVAWFAGITDLDPIIFDLPFERFLNPERVSMPDFDLDFGHDGRESLFAYIKSRYGEDMVAQVKTYGGIGLKKSIKVVCRATDVPAFISNAVSKAYIKAGEERDMATMISDGSFDKLIEKNPNWLPRLHLAHHLKDAYENRSTHAAAALIMSVPISGVLPVDAEGACQLPYKDAEYVGAVKFDLLGLKELDVRDRVALRMGIDIRHIPLDCERTLLYLREGSHVGLFQIAAQGISSLVRMVRVEKLSDLCAVVALYRPGPMDVGMHISFALRKNGREAISYLHSSLIEELEETYGVIVYQEQVMGVIRKVAGYSLGRADLVRRAMGKKIKAQMDAEMEGFLKGGRANGYNDNDLQLIWSQIETFARYGFNRAHSAAYGLLSYQTAYLKCRYPSHYLAAQATVRSDKLEDVGLFLRDARAHGITVLKPCVIESSTDFISTDSTIRYGLGAIKSLRQDTVESIRRWQAVGKKSFKSFMLDVAPPKDSLHALMWSGALDNLLGADDFESRGSIYKEMLRRGKELMKIANKEAAQVFMFEQDEAFEFERDGEQESMLEIAMRRHWHTGDWLDYSPFEIFADQLDSRFTLKDAAPQHDGLSIETKAMVHNVVEYTRIQDDGDESKFARLEVEDASGYYTAWWFNRWDGEWWTGRPRGEDDKPLLVHLRVLIKLRDDEVSFQVEDLQPFEIK